jgi:hypothetical protein
MNKEWKKHDFWKNIPDDCKKAINELKRLKVFQLCAFDYEETFADVWWLVLHEVDLYAEGEFCKEASRNRYHIVEPEAMNFSQAEKADAWLCRWIDLFNKYKEKKYHSDYWYKINLPYTDGEIFCYGGQI